jgi:sugar transferase (PEP-CTERM/EpsH1 system associated)
MRDLLFLAQRIPYPPNKGDKIRSWHFLRHLAMQYRVHLGAFVDDDADWQHRPVLEAACASCQLLPIAPRAARLRSLQGLASGEALTLPYFHDPRMASWVEEMLRARAPAAVFVFSSAMAQYVLPRSGDFRLVIDMVDMDSQKWQQYAAHKPWPLSLVYARESRRLLAFERQAAAAADVTLFVSGPEAELFRQAAPGIAGRIDHVSNGVDVDYFAPEHAGANPYPAGTDALVFTGMMDYWPNIDGVVWFADAIWPTLHRERPELRFVIVGANPAPEVLRLAERPGIAVTGRVPDVRPYLAHAMAAVAPLRVAQGVQNKVLEAMAMAKPVIASPQAVTGLDARPDDEILVAADAPGYLAALRRLAAGAALGLGECARAHVVRDHRWAENLRRLSGFVANTGC